MMACNIAVGVLLVRNEINWKFIELKISNLGIFTFLFILCRRLPSKFPLSFADRRRRICRANNWSQNSSSTWMGSEAGGSNEWALVYLVSKTISASAGNLDCLAASVCLVPTRTRTQITLALLSRYSAKYPPIFHFV